jgi:fatty-acyl-CoA synthase
MDDEGYISIVGRIKDMVIRGGENIYPREIEEFLHGHQSIADVQVIGVPDDVYGEELMAWVRLQPGESLTVEEIRTFCTGKDSQGRDARARGRDHRVAGPRHVVNR